MLQTMMSPTDAAAGRAQLVDAAGADAWYAVWTRSHCEQLVHDQLAAKGLRVLLPKLDIWSRRRGARRVIQTPMFPGYLFVGDVADRRTHLEVIAARGVVKVLGEGWDRLTPIPPAEMEAVVRLTALRAPVCACSYLQIGQRVRVVAGPLAGIEGILQRSPSHRGLLVLSVHLLRRSVAVVIDGVDVVPA